MREREANSLLKIQFSKKMEMEEDISHEHKNGTYKLGPSGNSI